MAVSITYFVHGTTTDNEQDISTGWNDGKLSALGIRQSRHLIDQVDADRFDVVFCSDLQRAIDSARLTFEGRKKILVDARLRECNYGRYNGKRETEGMKEHHILKRFPDGESYKDVELRMRDFLRYLERFFPGKRVAIVAHQAPQLALEVITKGKTWKQAFAQDWRKRKAWRPGWAYRC